MKLLLFLLASTTMFAHDYYFAFAEVAYNEDSNKLETTLTVSTHDLERALKKKNPELKDIGKLDINSSEAAFIETYLLSHFKLEGTSKINFKLIGFETNLKGMTNFYLESESIKIEDSLRINFDLLMDTYKEQQNKITFYYKGKTFTKPFLYTQRIQIINFNK